MTQEKRKLVIIPPNDKVCPEGMRSIAVVKSREVGVVSELGQGVTDEVRKEPGYHVRAKRLWSRATGPHLVITDSFGEAFAYGLVTYQIHGGRRAFLCKRTCEYQHKLVPLEPSVGHLSCATTARANS